jgi:hypothetical protein
VTQVMKVRNDVILTYRRTLVSHNDIATALIFSNDGKDRKRGIV